MSTLRICPNQRLHLCRPQEVLHAALVAAATVGQATAVTRAIHPAQGHAHALNPHLDVAERGALTVRLPAPYHALAHAHHHVAREEGVTHVLSQLRGPDRLLAGNEPEATRHLALLHPAAHALQVIPAHLRHYVGETDVTLPRQRAIAVSAVLAPHLAVAQGPRHTTPALLRALLHHAVAVTADHLRPAAKGHCLHVAGIPAPWKGLRRVRHLWRNQPSTTPWRISTLHVVA